MLPSPTVVVAGHNHPGLPLHNTWRKADLVAALASGSDEQKLRARNEVLRHWGDDAELVALAGSY